LTKSQLTWTELQECGVGSVTLFLHDHPVNQTRFNGVYGPSGFYLGDQTSGTLDNDRGVALEIEQNFPGNNVVFGVYDVKTSGLFFFTNGEIPGLSWYPNVKGPPIYYQYPPALPLGQ
jgi:hypothetical protein